MTKNENPQEIVRVAEIKGTLWTKVQLNDLKVQEQKATTQSSQYQREELWCYIDGVWKE